MKQAESVIDNEIKAAFAGVKPVSGNCEFDSWTEIPDAWLEKNADLFAFYSHVDELFFLPAFLCYLLRNDKDNPQSQLYIHISNTLGEYGKEKSPDCFKNSLSINQFSAVKAFIKHFCHNKSVNIDIEQWERILKNWQQVESKNEI